MKNYLLIINLVLFQIAFAQKDVYKIDPIHTIRKLKQAVLQPRLYSLVFKDVSIVKAGANRKTINPSYIKLETEVETLREEAEQLQSVYDKAYQKYADLEKIKSSLTKFQSSEKSFESKKQHLIEAQVLALEHGFGELIYADDHINSMKKSKFLLLKLNKLDLKVHLKRVSWKLNTLASSEPIKDTSKDDLLAVKEADLENTKKYKYFKSKGIKTEKSGLFINQKVTSIKSLKGDFVKVGKYCILKSDFKNEFLKGEVISYEEAMKYNFLATSKVTSPKMVFKNKKDDSIYISDINFLRMYAFTINGRFNKYAKNSNASNRAKSQLVSN